MLFVFVLAALATKFTPAQASSEVVSQLYDSTAITQPMAPSKLNSALTGLVRTVANFTTFPSNLQRAMLWGAGLVRVSGSDQYVQVYVQCGRTMSSIFPTAQTFDDSALCEIKNCKSNVITFTESTCDPSYVETKTLCALSPESEPSSVTFKQTGGPMWAMDGQIDDTIDPQLFQFNGTSSSDNTTIYMLAQKGSWPMSDDTCPNGAAFIVPCRKISSAEVNYGMQGSVWCEPEVEQSVQMWLSSGSLASATDNATVDGLSSPTIVGIIAACIAVGIVVLGLVVAQRRRSGANQGQTGLWNDDIITANRVPREKAVHACQ
ncbi:hypothetical protein PHYPSEUDO_013340 [Phytophthora pseudosyringae]|uniref:TKL protein kinase n=1 Tax=Phytophthora pseudosyringae TaxID=221518 RepID=A0A8T1W231_9STRA|nr:hypothetical protein PHYPSEUDO_013340 [Phytophthora pseudosyringae]